MKNIKVIFLVVFVSAIFSQSSAQRIINGTITDNNSNSVSNAFVEIINSSDTNLIYSDYTDANGFYEISANIVGNKAGNPKAPNKFLDLRNYPNPFNPSTIIYFNLHQPSLIKITIYDILGRKINSLYESHHSAGTGTVEWNSTNDKGGPVSAGIYFCRIETGHAVRVHKMLLIDGGGSWSSQSNNSHTNTANKQYNYLAEDPFLFNMRISGESFATREIDSLICWQDTTIDAQLNKIVSSIIGIGGGIIVTEGFQLSVPSGAFDSDYLISVHKDYKDNPFTNNKVSDVYQINGLPDTFSDSISLKLRVDGQLSNASYIIVGNEVISSDFETLINGFNFFEANESGGYLTIHLSTFTNSIQETNSTSKYADGNSVLKVSAVSDFLEPQYTTHFIIHCPFFLFNFIDDIKSLLEQNFTILGLCNLRFVEKGNPKISVIVGDLENIIGINSFPTISTSYYSINDKIPSRSSSTILIEESQVYNNNITEIKVSAGKTLFHSFYYEDFYIKSNVATKDVWIFTMMKHWLEVPFSLDTNYVSPIDFKGNEMAPFDGIFPNNFISYQKSIKHGLGMTAFFEFLVDQSKYGAQILGVIYQDLKNGATTSEALFSVDTWKEYQTDWPLFCKKYVNGDIYNASSKVFQQNLSADPLEINDADTSHTFHDYYIDLSAKIYQVNFNTPDIDSILVSVENENVHPMLFGLKYDDSIEFWDGLKIGGVKSKIVDGFDQVLIVVANNNMSPPNYRGVKEINLKVEVKTTSESKMDFDRCGLAINFGYGTWKRVWNETTYIDAVNINMQAKGSFTDESTFEGSWSDYTFWEGEGPRTGNCKVIIDPITKEILNFEFYQVTDHYLKYFENSLFKEISIKGSKKSLPVTHQDKYQLNYNAPDGSSLDYFNANDLSIKEIRYDDDPEYSKEYQLINYTDVPNTTFTIQFFYE